MFAACEANGTPIDTFLPPPGMETLLRERLGTRHGLLEQGPRDGGDPEVRTLVCAFVGDMVKGSICLGDGPRWTADRATAMLDAFSRAGVCEAI
ncbi:COBW domain-containing protein 1 [Verticillium dahliae VDG1]|nr:COBW domain-containing protein 1 [Verticillium dahliae VDG1]